MPSLQSLPDELLYHVALFVHPSSLLSFVLVDRRIFACLIKFMSRQTQLWQGKRSLHDRRPLTVPATLRHVVLDPFVAWYIRECEVWESRQSWNDWRGWKPEERRCDDYMPGPEREEALAEVNRNRGYGYLDSSFYSKYEFSHYQRLLTEVLHIDAKRARYWIKRIQSGFDEPLEAILFALCPRLTKITVMRYDT